MVIVRLKGGLGNQMFQYACGRALALRNNDVLKLDISGYTGTSDGVDTLRHYALAHFNIKADIATLEEVYTFRYRYGIFSKGYRFIREKILRQFNIGFDPCVLCRIGDVYLDGFWQSECYFTGIAENIRQEFTLRDDFVPAAKNIASAIKQTPISVSLHVRRGDYAKDPVTNRYWGTCSLEYYTAGMTYITSNQKNITVFVFSDDIDWVKNNITIPHPVIFVSAKDIPDYNEILLMSMCTHHIIANSSFSWWGAWLNKNRGKIIIAPRRWVIKGEHNYRSITPPSWIRL